MSPLDFLPFDFHCVHCAFPFFINQCLLMQGKKKHFSLQFVMEWLLRFHQSESDVPSRAAGEQRRFHHACVSQSGDRDWGRSSKPLTFSPGFIAGDTRVVCSAQPQSLLRHPWLCKSVHSPHSPSASKMPVFISRAATRGLSCCRHGLTVATKPP